jgi:protein-S-isoprenylcysteine O-methyltransferase Ste14
MPGETPASDGAAVRFPPPLVPLIALALGVLLHGFVWRLPLPVEGTLRWVLGGALVALGVGIMAAANGLFRSTGQDPKPWLSTPEIISTGIYGYTRNPMYLSLGLLQAGLGVLLANAWVVVLAPVACWVIDRTAIRHEEVYLEQKFGSTYAQYKSSVRRWL